MSNNSPGLIENKLLAFLQGLAEALKSSNPMAFRGGTADEATLRAMVEAELESYTKVHLLESQLRDAVAERRQNLPRVQQLMKDLQFGALATFGESSAACDRLGFPGRKKPRPLTSEERLLQTERLRATRVARHTLGPREKAKIKGVVPAPMRPPETPPSVPETPSTAPDT